MIRIAGKRRDWTTTELSHPTQARGASHSSPVLIPFYHAPSQGERPAVQLNYL